MLLSTHNKENRKKSSTIQSRTTPATLPFLPLANTTSAAPISLLVRVDEEEYLVLPNVTSIVPIRQGNLNPHVRHDIRIIAPMVGGEASETLQIEGIWIDEAGQLLPHQNIQGNTNGLFEEEQQTKFSTKTRMLEVVTDLPGSMARKDERKYTGTSRGVLGGVMGWEYMIGEMFASDHVTIGMDGMCLIPECIGGRGAPAGLADVFFQRCETFDVIEENTDIEV